MRQRWQAGVDQLDAPAVHEAPIAGDRDEPEQAGVLLGYAERLRLDSGVDVPAFLLDDVTRTREAGVAAVGPDAFAAAVERGRLGVEVPVSP